MRELILNESGGIYVLEDGRLCEYYPEDAETAAGDILLGVVRRVVRGMDAAFVDIGEERNAFLPLTERSRSFAGQTLQEGDRTLVQIRREAHEEKGAFLSRDIALCGEYSILMPMNRHIGVSAKIIDQGIRAGLRSLGEKLSEGRFGVVMRTSAAGADERAISEDIQSLCGSWEQIRRDFPVAHAPSCLMHAGTLAGLVRDLEPFGIERITVPDAVRIKQVLRYWDYPDKIAVGGAEKIPSLEKEIRIAMGRRVLLPSGAWIVIDECEALTAVDVNSGANTGARDVSATHLLVNMEACGEIARQLRLRNIGGIVLIDFIDLPDETARQAVRSELERELRKDRAKTVIHGYTSLGLMEMTRKRSSRTLREAMSLPKGTEG